MRYEVSERITTNADSSVLLSALEEQFKKISESTSRVGSVIEVKDIDASFGSINRSDTTQVTIKPIDGAFLIVGDVHYRPSVWFWIIMVILIWTAIFWLLPIIFYLVQKKTVRTGIEETFQRVKNEFASQAQLAPQGGAPHFNAPPPPSHTNQYYFVGSDFATYGPYNTGQMLEFIQGGQLGAESQVSVNGGAWGPANLISEFSFPPPPGPPPL